MRDDEFDQIFLEQTEIEPSPGFAAKVMEQVRCEASMPPPIPFPWLFLVPGLTLCIVVFILIVVQVFKRGFEQSFELAPVQAQIAPTIFARFMASLQVLAGSLLHASQTIGAGWILLALLLAIVSLLLSRRLTRGST